MKTYRIAWFALVEDDSVLEGRSLINAKNQEKALQDFYGQKTSEYRLKPHMITVQSITELQLVAASEESSS
ncbi:hypothetical protein SM124_23100 [Bacillus sp. 31A1R]|uniref:DUF1820 family protein n=1 Tax=Robertmurraya mangrovi TaxID=3098077 RepID=A0ABU5J571_9BACI|nr:hypothetical protein [Bacillus sp. 31A1R]MDZ5474568.1 hypothetical protein [Bacillus sp. 31A1R]